MANGWQTLGNAIGGGNELPSTIAYEQGMSLGANTQNALAEARARVQKNQAMDQLDQNLSGLITDPKQRAAVVGAIQAGQDPRNVTGSALDEFNLAQKQRIVAPDTADADVARSSLASGTGLPDIVRAVGTNGNLVNELHPDQGVQMSPLGTTIGQSEAAKNNAAAASSQSEVPVHQAQAALDTALARNGGAKLPGGYAPLLDANGQPVIDPKTGLPALAQRQGGPADVNAPRPMGAVEARMVNRSMDAANQSIQDLTQIASLPVGSSTGLLGYGRAPGKTLLESAANDLKNRLTSNDVQSYNVVGSGMSRALASLESAGQIPNGQFTGTFDKLQILNGDSAGTAALKLAKQRQIMESALQATILDNPRVPKAFQDKAQAYIDKMAQAIPYTPQDIIKLQNKDGNQTLGQSLGIMPKATAPAPAPAASPGGPAVGTIEDGYRFKGGDPSQQANWEKV